MEESGFSITIGGLIAALMRRIVLIISLSVLGAVSAVAVAYSLPPVFRSSATILVESQQIPSDLARSTVTSGTAERLKLIEQRLMTRNNLADIMEQLALYQDSTGATLTQLIQRMRGATRITPISVRSRRGDTDVAAFTISFTDANPQVTARVANEFVSRILEQNVESRRSRATETHSFFKNEVDRLRRELLDLEDQISRFKTQNRDAMPDSLPFRRGQLDELNHREFLMEQQIVALTERERQLNLALTDDAGSLFTREMSPVEGDLQALRREFVQKSAIYSSEHPEIRQLSARIRSLERTVAAETAGSEGEGADGEDAVSQVAARARTEIDSIGVQIETLQSQMTEIGTQREQIQESIRRTPGVETEMNNLDRRYQEVELQYIAAVRKQSEAATGEKLEVSRQAEQFEVIEQAQVPDRPIAPNRPIIAAGGVAGSVAFAFGIALLLELTSKKIHSREDLARLAKIRPIATVPMIRAAGERKRFARQKPSAPLKPQPKRGRA